MYGQFNDGRVRSRISAGSYLGEVVDIRGANMIAIECPTFEIGVVTATCNVHVQVANTTTTASFVRLHEMGVYSGGSGVLAWETPSGIGNFMARCPAAVGFDYMRIETLKQCTTTFDCYVHVQQ